MAVAGNGTAGSEGRLFTAVVAETVDSISKRATAAQSRQKFTRTLRVLTNFAGPTN